MKITENEMRKMFDEYDSKVFEGKPAEYKTFVESFCKFHFQPERSKREDLDFKKISDDFWNEMVSKELLINYEEENGALKVIDAFAEYLNSRYGALNTVETQ